MKNDFLQKLLNQNTRQEINPFSIIFIILQIIFLFLILSLTINILNANDKTEYQNIDSMSRVIINNFPEKESWLSNDDVNMIEKYLFSKVKGNNDNISNSEIIAEIRDGTYQTFYFEGSQSNYLSMLVDLPGLRQTYQIIHENPTEIFDPDTPTMVFCPDEYVEKKYPEFNCKETGDNISRNILVSVFFNRLQSNVYSVDGPRDSNVIYINPFFDATEEQQETYINEIKDFVKKLGISPELYDYRVLSHQNLTYELY